MDTINDRVQNAWKTFILLPSAMSANIISLPCAAISTAVVARNNRDLSRNALRVRFLKTYCAALTVSFLGLSYYKYWKTQQFLKSLEEGENKS